MAGSTIPVILRIMAQRDPQFAAVLRAAAADLESVERSAGQVGVTIREVDPAPFQRVSRAAQQLGTEVREAAQKGVDGLKRMEGAADAAARRLEHLKYISLGLAEGAAYLGNQGNIRPSGPTPIPRSQLAALANNDLLTAQRAALPGVAAGGVSFAAQEQAIQKVTVSMRDLHGVSRALNTTLERAQEEYRRTTATAVEFGSQAGLGMIAAGAAVLGIAGFAIKVAGEFEQLRAQLETVRHSATKAAETFEFAKQLAAKTPFDVRGVVEAAVILERFRVQAQRVLPFVADLAAGMGRRIQDAALVIGKAMTGSAEALESLRNEWGIGSARLAQFGAVLTKTGSVSVASTGDVEKLRGALERLIQTEFGGAIERQSRTLQGAVSNALDSGTNLVAAWGEDLVPMATTVAKGVSLVADTFASVPGPMRAVASVGALVAAGTLALGGAALVATSGLLAMNTQLEAAALRMPQLAGAARVTSGVLGLLGRAAAGAGSAFTWLTTTPWGLAVAGLSVATGAAVVAMNAYEQSAAALGKKLADQSHQVQQTAQAWRQLKQAIEDASGTEVDFGADVRETVRQIAEGMENANPSRLLSAFKSQGFGIKEMEEALKGVRGEADATREQIRDLNELLDYLERHRATALALQSAGPDKEMSAQARGLFPEKSRFSSVDIDEVREKLALLNSEFEKTGKLSALLQSAIDRFRGFEGPIEKALKAAEALTNYLKFANKSNDIGTMTAALEETERTLKQVQEAAQKAFGKDAFDPEALSRRLLDPDITEDEKKQIEAILALMDLRHDQIQRINQENKRTHEESIRLMDEKHARERAGQGESLVAELAYLRKKLEAVKGHAAEETQVLEQIATTEKALHAKRLAEKKGDLDKSIKDALAAAEALASGGKATAAEVAQSYQGVVRLLDAWAAAHGPLLKTVPELRKHYEDLRRTVEGKATAAEGKVPGERLQDLRLAAQDVGVGATTPREQLSAVRQQLDLYERTLRTDRQLREDDDARRSILREMNQLRHRELQLVEQVATQERQHAQEAQNLYLQGLDLRIGLLEDLRSRQAEHSQLSLQEAESLARQTLTATGEELEAIEERLAAGSVVEEELSRLRQERYEAALKLIELEREAEVEAAHGAIRAIELAQERAALKRHQLLEEERTRVKRVIDDQVKAQEAADKKRADSFEESQRRIEEHRRKYDPERRKGGRHSPLQTMEEAFSRGFSLGEGPGAPDFGEGFGDPNYNPFKPKEKKPDSEYDVAAKKVAGFGDATEVAKGKVEGLPKPLDTLGVSATTTSDNIKTLGGAAIQAAAALQNVGKGGGGGGGETPTPDDKTKTGPKPAEQHSEGWMNDPHMPDPPPVGGGSGSGGYPGDGTYPTQKLRGLPTPRVPTPREMGAVPLPRVPAASVVSTTTRSEVNQITNVNIDGRRQSGDADVDAAMRHLNRKLDRERMYRGTWGR